MHQSWKKFDELQHEWHAKAEELAVRNTLLEADAAFVKITMDKMKSSKKRQNVTPRKFSFLEFGHVYVYCMLYAYVI